MTSIDPQIVVAKFGGTSVADFDAMNLSADIILADEQVRLVVLSASAGVTNLLVELSEGLESSDRTNKINALRTIQYNVISRLKQPIAIRREIDRLLNNIELLAETAFNANSKALTDELVSHGELMSTLLFVEILRERNIETRWFDAREVIRTNDCFGHADPILSDIFELTKQKLRPQLKQSLIVTQGFIGSEIHGRTTTLGRGGSDYTAALLGEALHAARVDIWTDVAGIYTTDPRIVPKAQRIDRITFSEASEMAAFGAKVLHPATLLPAVRKDIPVFVGSSKNPTAGGTLVCTQTNNSPRYRALAIRRKQTLLSLQSLDMSLSCAFLAGIFAVLSRHHISLDLVTTSQTRISITLDSTGSTSVNTDLLTTSLLTELSSLCHIAVEENLALVTLIGNNLSRECSVAKDVFGELENHIIRMIYYGTSNHNLCILVPEKNADSAVQKLHQKLFESPLSTDV